ncbi:hypothetical protein [uncultured Gimesia sp.]|uniref:hypothetical protein n=1 Tax=uncultured Gimesia sp. TaxID=1678688 RepID=UPI0030DCEEBF|tara:strand:+ start:194097 stop:197012 length:2916 start_codon:yes stop_codon:yes gene_type:complete
MPSKIGKLIQVRSIFLVVLVLELLGSSLLRAETFQANFDDTSKVSWQVRIDSSQAQKKWHVRNTTVPHEGAACEHLQIVTGNLGSLIELSHRLPSSRIINELTASLWFKSNRRGTRIGLEAVLPHQIDPETGTPARIYLIGDTYTDESKWQELKCTTTDTLVNQSLGLLRGRSKLRQVDTREMYVERVLIVTRSSSDKVEFLIDDLKLSPIVHPNQRVLQTAAALNKQHSKPIVEFLLDRVQLQGKPMFPRMSRFHGEELSELKRTGLNVIWAPEFDDYQFLSQLRSHGLWAMATPPRPQAQDGSWLPSRDATLIPFDKQTAPIIFWNLGTQIPGKQWDEIRSRVGQIQSADQQFKRPIMADVLGKERQIAREVSMIGSSPHILNSDISLLQYRDTLIEKTRIAPGRFLWTWIQTEPTSANVRWRSLSNKSPIIIEPEQIRLQTYATLSAGCRGNAYWTTTRLDDTTIPGALERKLVIRQLNMEIDLIEHWLATGSVISHVPFSLRQQETPRIKQLSAAFKNSGAKRLLRDELLSEREIQIQRENQSRQEMQAAIIHSEYGTLILPVWYREGSQFVPDQMAGNDATIVIPGGNVSASVWELSTTEIKNLDRKRVNGGVQITIPKFDMTSIIIMTSDQGLIEKLRQKVASLSRPSAETSVQLCRAKLERCQKTNAKLVQLGVSQIARMDGPAILDRALSLAKQAEGALTAQDFHAARTHARDSMQMLRILQRSQWREATRTLSSAITSPYTISYSTLPDHWEMISKIGRSGKNIEANLLRSGDFEDIDTWVVEGWKHEQNAIEGTQTIAELYPHDKKSGDFSLRLLAAPLSRKQMPVHIEGPLVKVTTPPLAVHSGQIVHVTGWVKVSSPITGNPQGATLQDSIMGPGGALHWNAQSGWQKIDLIREVPQTDNLILTLSLNGMGSILFDDLRVIAYTPEPKLYQQINAAETPPLLKSADENSSGFNFLKKLP